MFYSALHRVNYWFDARTGRAPKNHAEGSRLVEGGPPMAFSYYKTLYLPSTRARYCEGFGLGDARRRLAVKMLDKIEKEIPFS